MMRLASRIDALERRSGGTFAPRRVVAVAGTDTSDDALAAFLTPYRIDPGAEDTMVIAIGPLRALEGSEPVIFADVPLGFVGAAPDWISAMPAHQLGNS